MTSDFYKAFEDKCRGNRDLIKTRLQVYLPFLDPLQRIYPGTQMLDLGCGRGEWLELLRDLGINAYGVDLDANMLSVCHDLKLSVKLEDVIVCLQNLPDETKSVISGFHIAEHLAFDDLQTLVQESKRVLKPGGLLILETPNPENIIVGSKNFYLDPTHQKPVPPELLSFICEYYEFKRIKLLRLQEHKDIYNKKELTLLDVLQGVSPDYAVVAQKAASDDILQLTDSVFQLNYGITLEELSIRYHHQTQQQQQQRLELMLQESQQQQQRLEAMLQESQQQRQRLEAVLQESQQQRQRLEAMLQESQQQREYVELMLHNVTNSRSMYITLPLRLIAHQARNLKQLIKISLSTPKPLVKQSAKRLLIRIAYKFSGNSQLKSIALNILRYSPKLKHRLKILLLTNRIPYPHNLEPTHISTLSPHAKRIFHDLKKAIEETHR